MRIVYSFLFLFITYLSAFDMSRLDSYSLSEVVEHLATNLNENLPQHQNHIITIEEAEPKYEDTLQITKTLKAQPNDINSAILIDTILNSYNQDRDFIEDFIESEINIFCGSEYGKYLFKRGGYIRVILINPQDGKTITYFDLAQKSCE
jgi:hypothetical protein